MSKVWLITGAGRGLGLSFVQAALRDGARVLATARKPNVFAELQATYGEQLASFALDVTDEAQAKAAVAEAVKRFGRLDVLVNNAGYGHVQPFEHTPVDDFRDQVETNFFGVVNLTRAAIPVLRQNGGGQIFQVSSVGGRITTPGLAAYQAAKWAVGGFSDVVGQEVAPFGIQICTLEPGGMRTDWGFTARSTLEHLHADYAPSMAQFKALLDAYVGQEVGDPERIAQLLVELTHQPQLPARLLLGSDACQYAQAVEDARRKQDQRWKSVSLAADFDAAPPTWPAE